MIAQVGALVGAWIRIERRLARLEASIEHLLHRNPNTRSDDHVAR